MDPGIVLTSPFGHSFCFYFQSEFDGIDNIFKYKALLHGFQLAKHCDTKLSNIIGDYNLILMQVKELFSKK